MHSTSHDTSFTPVGKIALDQLIAHLRSAARYPLRVAAIGTATFIDDDPGAEQIAFDRTVVSRSATRSPKRSRRPKGTASFVDPPDREGR